jgi:hypothetical protein
MTTEWKRSIAAALILVLVGVSVSIAISCATTTSNRIGDSLDTAQYPPDIRDAYKVFAVRCSRCHTLARPLNARINDPQQWVRYVQRMRLNPASGINAKNGEIILRFLLYYMHQRQKERGEQGSEIESSPEPSAEEVPLGAAGDGALENGSSPVSSSSKGDGSEVGMPEPQTSATEATP